MPLDYSALCARGEAADLLYSIARYDEAEKVYLQLYQEMRDDGVVDMYLASKIALSLLLTWIESGQTHRAFALWTASPRDDMGEGIYAIERGQTTLHDAIVYQCISAYFQSLSAEDVTTATEAVNVLMQRVCDHAREHDPGMMALAIGDWKQFLMQLHGQVVPQAFAVKVVIEQERYGKPIVLDGVDFPMPSSWKRPA